MEKVRVLRLNLAARLVGPAPHPRRRGSRTRARESLGAIMISKIRILHPQYSCSPFNDRGVEITCPPTNAQIAGYAVAGLAGQSLPFFGPIVVLISVPLLGVLLLIALGYTIRDKFSRRRRALKADDRDLEEDKENQQMLDHGKDGAGEDSDSSDVSVLAVEFDG